jgi:hypothetical protein
MRKVRKLYLAMGLALVAMFVLAGAAFAAYTFDFGYRQRLRRQG